MKLMKGPEQWIKSQTPTSIGSNSLISLMLDQLYLMKFHQKM